MKQKVHACLLPRPVRFQGRRWWALGSSQPGGPRTWLPCPWCHTSRLSPPENQLSLWSFDSSLPCHRPFQSAKFWTNSFNKYLDNSEQIGIGPSWPKQNVEDSWNNKKLRITATERGNLKLEDNAKTWRKFSCLRHCEIFKEQSWKFGVPLETLRKNSFFKAWNFNQFRLISSIDLVKRLKRTDPTKRSPSGVIQMSSKDESVGPSQVPAPAPKATKNS